MERDLVKLIVMSLQIQFGRDAVYLNKNHGDMYQSHGRPDLEGCIFGRHFGFEVKSGSRFSPMQVTHLNRIARAGGLAAGIVGVKGKVYYLNVNQVSSYSLKNISEWKEIEDLKMYPGKGRRLCFKFLYKYLNKFFLYYHGDEDVQHPIAGPLPEQRKR